MNYDDLNRFVWKHLPGFNNPELDRNSIMKRIIQFLNDSILKKNSKDHDINWTFLDDHARLEN